MINDNTVDGGRSLQSKGCHRILCLIDKFFGPVLGCRRTCHTDLRYLNQLY